MNCRAQPNRWLRRIAPSSTKYATVVCSARPNTPNAQASLPKNARSTADSAIATKKPEMTRARNTAGPHALNAWTYPSSFVICSSCGENVPA
jgi:hypothetical protein